MARAKKSLLNELSTADLKRLLVARERIDILEKEKSKLLKELATVESELRGLMTGTAGKRTVRRASKKTSRKVTAKKAATKKAGKKTVRAAAKKKAPRAAKRGKKKVATGGRVTLEDVVVQVIKKNGAPVAFKDLMAKIVKGKLFKSKSKSFDNVLRRTLSTSQKVKRAGRGVYDVA